jgi:hypothetical protein
MAREEGAGEDLRDHWVVLGRLRGARVTLAEVIRQ